MPLLLAHFERVYNANFFSFFRKSNEIFRFNLEQGCFKTSLESATSSENNCCEFNPVNELFACGNTDGVVECWDPRAPKHVGVLNCCVDELFDDTGVNNKSTATKNKCAITALKFRDGLNLAVGTSTGHVTTLSNKINIFFSI